MKKKFLTFSGFFLLAASALAADRYWVATTSANWNDTANWSATSGGTGGQTVPGNADIAIFDGNGTGDCTINISVNVGGISMAAGYSGTITQGAQAMAIGNSYFTQAGGTYSCGAGAFKTAALLLDGGTFQMPDDATMEIHNSTSSDKTLLRRGASATFNTTNINLIVRFQFYNSSSDDRFGDIYWGGTNTVKSLRITGGNTGYRTDARVRLQTGDKILVRRNLIVEADSSADPHLRLMLDRGAIDVYGDVVFGHPTAPELHPNKPEWTNVGLNGGSCVITLTGENDQTLTHYHMLTNHISGVTLTINKSVGTVRVLSDVRFGGSGGLVWTAGGLDVGSNTLTVVNALTIGTAATTLGVTVADATTVGNIVAGGDASALGNVDLALTVTATPTEVEGQTYTILRNSTAVATFADVTWLNRWKGTVSYTDNTGKNVTLSDIVLPPKGTVLIFQARSGFPKRIIYS